MTHLYQAIYRDKVCFEAETTAALHNDILNAELDSLPHYTIILLDDESEPVAFDDKAFMANLRDAFDEQLTDAHFKDLYCDVKEC